MTAVSILALLPAHASAVWTSPVSVGTGAALAAGMDDSGTLTMLLDPQEGGPVLVSRSPRTGRVTRQTLLADPSAAPQRVLLGVVPSGGIVVAYVEAGRCASTCPSRLYYREGRDISSLTPPRLLAEREFPVPLPGPRGEGLAPTLAVGAKGHIVLAWREGGGDGGPVSVMTKAPGTQPGTPQRVFGGGGSNQGRGTVEVAVNGRGDALVAWAQPDGSPLGAAFQAAGRGFVSAQGLPSGTLTSAAVDPRGKASVGIDQGARTIVADRAPDGSFGRPTGLTGQSGELIASPQGAQLVATLAQAPFPRPARSVPARAALRRPDGSFAAARTLDDFTTSLEDPTLEGQPAVIDARGNLFAALMGTETGSYRLSLLRRFDRTPSFLRIGTGQRYGVQVATNATGRAALTFTGAPGSTVYVRERPADRRAAGLAVGTVRRRGTTIALPVRCSESCVVRGELGVTVRKRTVRASRPVMLRGRAGGRLSLRVTRSEVGRLRRLVRRGRNARIIVRVRAEDTWGNARVVRRRVQAARLLR